MKLRLWWMPKIPSENAFFVHVKSVEQAVMVHNILANYDLYLNKHGLKKDFSNCGSLEMFNEATQKWEEWEEPVTGIDFCEALDYYDTISNIHERNSHETDNN